MAEVIASKIDQSPELLDGVREWAARHDARAIVEWRSILEKPWPEVKAILLDPSEEGKRLRQSSPFVGILTPQERWSFYR